MTRTKQVDLVQISKVLKPMRIDAQDIGNAISDGALSFEEVKNLYKRHDVPRFIDDVPVWLYAYKEGCPEFFVVDLNRKEDLLAKASGSTKRDEYPYMRSIYGFSKTIGTIDMSIWQFKDEEHELKDTFSKFIAILLEHATPVVSEDDMDELIEKSANTIPAGAFVQAGDEAWPSHIDYVPTWLYARENAFGSASDKLLELDIDRYLALARPDLSMGEGEWEDVHAEVCACLRDDE